MNLAEQKICREFTHEWRVEKVEKTLYGIRIHVEGAEFPQKGIPTPEALVALGIFKKTIISWLRLFRLPVFWPSLLLIGILPKRKNLETIVGNVNDLGRLTLSPYRLPLAELCPAAQSLGAFASITLMELGIDRELAMHFGTNIATIFDYDMAYRWRAQDLFSETTREKFLTQKELKRLGKLVGERDLERTAASSRQVLRLLRLALLLPSLRRALHVALNKITFENLQFDESDVYWCCFRTDYKFFGLSDEERMQMVKDKGWKIPLSYPLDEVVT